MPVPSGKELYIYFLLSLHYGWKLVHPRICRHETDLKPFKTALFHLTTKRAMSLIEGIAGGEKSGPHSWARPRSF